MMKKQIRVGLIGIGNWASYGHVPLLQLLPEYEIVAVLSRSLEKAKHFADQYEIAHYFNDEDDFFALDAIDLVVITTPGSTHYHYAKKALLAGKDAYSEWPLTTSLEQSEELLALAKEKGLRHIVGLQRRFSPSARYLKDLLDNGTIGDLRSVHMSLGVDAFSADMPSNYAWTFSAENYTNVLTIYSGHFSDMLFHIVGQPTKVFGMVETQFPYFNVTDTGEKVENHNPNQVAMMGSLEKGLFTLNIEGAQKDITGLSIEITGTKGTIRMMNKRGFQNTEDNTLSILHNQKETFEVLNIPDSYRTLPENQLDNSVQDVGYLYQAYANDVANETNTVTSFKDAVRQHQLIDRVLTTNEELNNVE
ncbi:Gfo/Idh/MocA family protein [Enterococcus pingfangensis]